MISSSMRLLLVGVHQLVDRLLRQQPARQQRLEDGVVQRLHRVVRVGPGRHLLAREPARQQEVGQLRQQVLEVEAVEFVAGELRVPVAHRARLLPFDGLAGGGLRDVGPAQAAGHRRSSVVVLLLPCGRPSSNIGSAWRRGPPRARLLAGAVVAALVAAGDLLERVEALEDEVHRRRRSRGPARPARRRPRCTSSSSPGTLLACLTHLAGRVGVAQLQRTARVEPADDLRRVGPLEVAGEHVRDRRPHQFARHRLGALQLALVLELELAGDRRQRRVDVGDARHRHALAGGQRAPLGVRHDVLEARDRHALADARPLVDLLVVARLERDLLDHLAHERRAPAPRSPSSARSIQASCAVIAIAFCRVAG